MILPQIPSPDSIQVRYDTVVLPLLLCISKDIWDLNLFVVDANLPILWKSVVARLFETTGRVKYPFLLSLCFFNRISFCLRWISLVCSRCLYKSATTAFRCNSFWLPLVNPLNVASPRMPLDLLYTKALKLPICFLSSSILAQHCFREVVVSWSISSLSLSLIPAFDEKCSRVSM